MLDKSYDISKILHSNFIFFRLYNFTRYSISIRDFVKISTNSPKLLPNYSYYYPLSLLPSLQQLPKLHTFRKSPISSQSFRSQLRFPFQAHNAPISRSSCFLISLITSRCRATTLHDCKLNRDSLKLIDPVFPLSSPIYRRNLNC